MYTIYIDTHCNKIILVLYKENQIKAKKEIETQYNHSLTTMPNLIDLLEENEIEIKEVKEIIVCNGPGSFTGIRIGVTIAKTLAYTLNIPIKVISSLLIKAISFEHQNITVIEKEKNGIFLAKFDKENNLQGEYQYLKNNELSKIKEEVIEEIPLDYLKILEFAQKLKPINPHQVNPLYVKKIEVQK